MGLRPDAPPRQINLIEISGLTDRPTDRPDLTDLTGTECPTCYRFTQRTRSRYTCAEPVEFLCGPIPAYTALSICANLIFPNGLA